MLEKWGFSTHGRWIKRMSAVQIGRAGQEIGARCARGKKNQDTPL